ncbi:MAG: LLM class flavin-dependent oxidoreductase [Alphaproteobacteria bacterium]|nr:LLM class flavin-dependent oxidoreductase [Alphaproteobacteria bacterium]
MRYSMFSVHDHYPEEGRSVATHYNETMDHMVLAEELGYESFWLAEHHFHEYGTVPNPAVFLAAAAQRTERIGLGMAVSVLPFHHPLRVAEDYAMVDILSRGRLILGVGSGYIAHEFEGFGVSGATKREHFDENLDVLRRAFSGEAVSLHSGFNQIDNVAVNVPPVQRPHPPIYMAALRRESAYFIGRQGYPMLGIPYASVDELDELAGMVADYERGWAESGADETAPPVCFAFHTYCGETDAQAREDAEAPFDYYVRTRLYGKSAGWDEITQRGYCLMGGVETCIERLRRMQQLGIGHVAMMMDFGCMGREKTQASMRLFAEKVMPAVGND